jgi:hypothetical protein
MLGGKCKTVIVHFLCHIGDVSETQMKTGLNSILTNKINACSATEAMT